MVTALSPERLVELRAEGIEQEKESPFVNPHMIVQCLEIQRRRGEEWMASVLSRPLTRRSVVKPSFPWLNRGEGEMLVLADAEETMATLARYN
jgi:hypothetical protein